MQLNVALKKKNSKIISLWVSFYEMRPDLSLEVNFSKNEVSFLIDLFYDKGLQKTSKNIGYVWQI